MTTTGLARRGGRGLHGKSALVQQNRGAKSSTLPKYLEMAVVEALITAAP